MSEAKPLDAIGEWLDLQNRDDAVQRAARQYATEFRMAQHAVAHHLRNAASLARTHGHENLLALLPQDVAAAVSVLRDALVAGWSQLSSDEVPLFENPPEPEPTPEPEPEPEP